MTSSRNRSLLGLGLVLLSIVMILASLLIGTESLSMHRAWDEWRSGRTIPECPTLSILFQQRLPRTLAALIAGAGLALVGCSFQALLRNPLATPYTLGVASAGAFGAWMATVLLEGTALWVSFLGFSPIQICAFAFCALDVLLLYLLASRRRRISPTVLLLTGVTIGMLANAGILLMRYLAMPDQLMMMDRWLMGAVDVIGFEPVTTLFIGVTPCLIVLLAQAGRFDQLGFNAEMAEGRGVRVGRLQLVTFFTGSLMTAIIVSTVGPIGFVGLIVPHSVRAITGSRHRILMPLSLIAGGGFLCFCDIVGRRLVTGEAPIGIVTALLGGPVFIYLLVQRRFADWD
jgi:iron complex transport system permease protein